MAGAIRSEKCMKGHTFVVRGKRQVCVECSKLRVRAYRDRKKKQKSTD